MFCKFETKLYICIMALIYFLLGTGLVAILLLVRLYIQERRNAHSAV